jgi:hypothetical protein
MSFNPLLTVFIFISFFVWVFSNFLRSDIPLEKISQNKNISTNIFSDELVSDGFDLKALPAILKEVNNVEDIEKKLNQPNGINNLDLNNDGEVDYIKVTQIKLQGEKIPKGAYGFSLTTEVEKGQNQEIATIEIIPQKEKVKVSTFGNEQIYGKNYGYNSFYSMSSFFLMGYLLNSRTFYSSPYGYRNYPSSYSSYSRVNNSDYTRRSSSFSSSATKSSSSPIFNKSSAANKTANSGIKRSLKNPTTSQKAFRQRGVSKLNRGGFGRKPNLGSRSLRRSSFFGSKRSSLGGLRNFGNRKSFGGGGRSFRGFGRGFGGFRGFRR